MVVLRAVLGGWYAEPVPLIAAAAAVLVYDAGARRLARIDAARAPTRGQKILLVAGVTTVLVALLSPLDALALRFQWVHMVQHVLLLVAAPPLIVLARPWETGRAAFEGRLRRQLDRPVALVSSHARRVALAVAAVVLFVGVLWLWHVPYLYDLTLRDDMVHNLEHTAFLAVGLLFWTAALPPAGQPAPLGILGRSVLVLAGMVGSWMLAVYLGYATTALYSYTGSATLSATSDQQLAAGVMWVPASVPFVAVLVWLGARWLDDDARAAAAEAAHRAGAGA